MYSVDDTLAGGLPHSDIHGSTPARGSPWLFAACHVLHRLLVPRHPPNALLSLEIALGLDPRVSTMHRNHPQTANRPRRAPRIDPGNSFSAKRNHLRSAHNRSITPPGPHRSAHAQWNLHASEHHTIAGRPRLSPRTFRSDMRWLRPETHQNLIHPDKDHPWPSSPDLIRRSPRNAPPTGDTNGTARAATRNTNSAEFFHFSRYSPPEPRHRRHHWWRRSGSNRRPPACKAGALPAELRPQFQRNGGPGRI